MAGLLVFADEPFIVQSVRFVRLVAATISAITDLNVSSCPGLIETYSGQCTLLDMAFPPFCRQWLEYTPETVDLNWGLAE